MSWLELAAYAIGGTLVVAVWVMIAAMIIGFVVSVPGYIREIMHEKRKRFRD